MEQLKTKGRFLLHENHPLQAEVHATKIFLAVKYSLFRNQKPLASCNDSCKQNKTCNLQIFVTIYPLFCLLISLQGYIDFGRFDTLNEFVTGSGHIDFVQVTLGRTTFLRISS